MSHATPGARALAFVLTAGIATIAAATGQRSFVASNGNDANPCTLAQPCRGFAHAVANTNDGGEVIVLDSAGYGAVTITKSITLAAPPGIYGGISVFAGDGITVDGVNIVVVLRGLSINNQGGDNGVAFVQGKELLIQDCEVSGFSTYNAVQATAPNSVITIRNSTLRESDTGFHALGTVSATLDAVRIYSNNSYGVRAETGSKVTVTNSVIADTGFTSVEAEGSALTDLTVTRSVITRCNYAVSVLAFPGGTARIVLDGSTITEATTAFNFSGFGGTELIYSPGNNIVGFATNVVTGGALSPCCNL